MSSHLVSRRAAAAAGPGPQQFVGYSGRWWLHNAQQAYGATYPPHDGPCVEHEVQQYGQSAPLAVPQLGSCASSKRAWWLRTAQYSQEEAGSLSAQPLPRLLEPAAPKAANLTAFAIQAEPDRWNRNFRSEVPRSTLTLTPNSNP